MKKATIAIIGAGEAAGGGVLEAFEARGMLVEDLRLLATPETLTGDELCFGDRVYKESLLGEEAFAGVTVAIFAAGREQARKWVRAAREAGCWVIDATGALAGKAPAIVPELNAGAIPDRPAMIASPSPAVVALALTLAPLRRAAGLRRVIVSTYHGASGLGRSGMAELVEQTQAILAGAEPTPESFPHRLAFNVIPQSDAFEAEGPTAGWTREEAGIIRDLPLVLDTAGLAVSATAARIPVFTGLALSVNAELVSEISLEKAQAALAAAPGVQLLDEPSFHLYPLLGEIVGRNDAYVGRVRIDPTAPHALNMWVAIDDLRRGVGLNVAGIVECLP